MTDRKLMFAGNTLTDANGQKFTYDGENKQTEVKDSSNATVGHYYYDGDGKRIKKIAGDETTIFVYDAAGKQIAEYSTIVATLADLTGLHTSNISRRSTAAKKTLHKDQILNKLLKDVLHEYRQQN